MIAPLDIRIGEVGGETVAYTIHKGAYRGMREGFTRLQDWTRERGYTPMGPPRAAHLNNPREVPESDLLTECQVPVPSWAIPVEAPPGSCGIKVIPAAKVARCTYEGSSEGIHTVYEELFAWLGAQGYTAAGPPREIHSEIPAPTPGMLRFEIQLPVVPGARPAAPPAAAPERRTPERTKRPAPQPAAAPELGPPAERPRRPARPAAARAKALPAARRAAARAKPRGAARRRVTSTRARAKARPRPAARAAGRKTPRTRAAARPARRRPARARAATRGRAPARATRRRTGGAARRRR